MELRECPFCGNTAQSPSWLALQAGYENGVECSFCGACSYSIEEWNSRPLEDKLRQRIAELEPKPSQTPFMDYLKQVRDKTAPDSEQWDAINGAMHELDDRRAENERLRAEAEMGNIPYREAIRLQKRVKELEQLIAADREFTESDDDAEWSPPHPIFSMALSNDILRNRVGEMEGLLSVANCPNCDGSGVIARRVSCGQTVSRDMAMDAGCPDMEGSCHTEDEWEPEECQWCAERKALTTTGEEGRVREKPVAPANRIIRDTRSKPDEEGSGE